MSSVMALDPNVPSPPQAAVVPSAPPLSGRVVAFTTPPNYSPRLSRLLSLRGAAPLPLPTIAVGPTPQELRRFLHAHSIELFAGVAFTSRTGISAFSLALEGWAPPPLPDSGPTFIVAALGKDAEIFSEDGFVNKLCGNPTRIRVLVPDIASPAGLVKSLGVGNGRRILCPVPSVVDLTEPPVIPDFIKDLEAAGWNPVRVAAYETRWMGPKCVEGLVTLDGNLDAILFTSTAEVEGFLKGLEEFGWHWGAVRRRWPEIVVGAHGPVTAKGAESFGVAVDVAEILDPAVSGTLNVLQACKKNPALIRVVLTSSSTAVRTRDDIDPTVPLDESSWSSVELCERRQLWYALAKILAEKAAWEFAKENNINLVTVIPSFVIGPSLPHDMCLTLSDVVGLLRGNSEEFSLHGRMGYVHIDDVACCHILLYEDGNAHGRYLCSSTVLDNHELATILSNRYPSLPIPRSFHSYYKMVPYVFDTSKLRNMGFQFKGVEEMFDDCIQFLKERGYINF